MKKFADRKGRTFSRTVAGKDYRYRAMSLGAREIMLQEVATEDDIPLFSVQSTLEEFSDLDFNTAPYYAAALILLDIFQVSGIGNLSLSAAHVTDDEKCVKGRLRGQVNFSEVQLSEPDEDYSAEFTIEDHVIKVAPMNLTEYFEIAGMPNATSSDIIFRCVEMMKTAEGDVLTKAENKAEIQKVILDFSITDELEDLIDYVITLPDVFIDLSLKCDSCGTVEKIRYIGLKDLFF